MKKKTVYFVGTFLVIYIINFFIPRLMPGDPFLYMQEISESATSYSEEDLEKLRNYYGLDQSIPEQFVRTFENNLHGEFGQSIYYKQPVSQVISERLPWTMFVMFSTLVFSILVGIILAGISVRFTNIDSILYHFMSIVIEIPAYLIGILILFLIAAQVRWIPLSGAVTPFMEYTSMWEYGKDVLIHGLMPILSLSVITIPGFYFVARTSFLTILERKYIMNGVAKGLGNGRILTHYIMLNAVFPIGAKFFLSVGSAIGGTMLVENVYAYPGLGTVIRLAVRYRDFPLIQGVFLLSTTVVMISSYMSDLINYYLSRKTAGADE